MLLNATLLNTQHYKVSTKGKVEQSRKWSSYLAVVAIEKGAFGSPLTKIANFDYIHLYTHTHTHTHIYIYIYICVCVSVCV